MKANRITVALFLCGFLAVSSFGQTREIKNIRYQKVGDELVVSIDTENIIPFESYTLFNPSRLVIDFMGVTKIYKSNDISVNINGVLSIRTGQPFPAVNRIVFDLSDSVPRYKIEEAEGMLKIFFWQEEEKIEEPAVRVQEKTEPETKEPKKKEPVKTQEEKPRREKKTIEDAGEKKFTFGVNSGLYMMQDDVFKEVYGNGMLSIGAEYSFNLPIGSFKGFNVWAGFKCLSGKGQSSFLQEDVKLSITHASLAVRYLLSEGKFTFFFGPGMDYIVYKESYTESYHFESLDGSDLGLHIQAGSDFHFLPSLSLKGLIKYNIAKTTKEGVEVDLGGVEFGLGVIYRFNL